MAHPARRGRDKPEDSIPIPITSSVPNLEPMNLNKLSIADIDVKDKRVLMRVDFNVPQVLAAAAHAIIVTLSPLPPRRAASVHAHHALRHRRRTGRSRTTSASTAPSQRSGSRSTAARGPLSSCRTSVGPTASRTRR